MEGVVLSICREEEQLHNNISIPRKKTMAHDLAHDGFLGGAGGKEASC